VNRDYFMFVFHIKSFFGIEPFLIYPNKPRIKLELTGFVVVYRQTLKIRRFQVNIK